MAKFNSFDRFILYATLAIVIGIGFRLKTIEEKLEKPRYEIRKENIVGKDIPEKFYEINGRKAYLEIDGRSVEQHFKLKKYFKKKSSDLSYLAKY